MATIHMSEGELARDVHAVLGICSAVGQQSGVEIVIEQDHRPVAVLMAPSSSGAPGRKLSECIALASGIDSRRDSFEPPEWDWSSTPAY